jgi:hypothetical protein
VVPKVDALQGEEVCRWVVVGDLVQASPDDAAERK